jgi:membrane protease YdiL (CAAX protease family)
LFVQEYHINIYLSIRREATPCKLNLLNWNAQDKPCNSPMAGRSATPRKENKMKTWIRKHQLVSYFFLAYFIMYAAFFGYILLQPGQPLQAWSLVWAIGIFSPTISSLLVSWVIGGGTEVKHLLAGFTRWKVGLGWYFAALFLLLGPLVIALVYIALGHPAAGIRPGVTFPSMLGIIAFQFFSGPFAEETGWRGFALPRLQEKYNALVSSLILGVIWTFWHLPLFFLTGATQMGIPMPIYLFLVLTITVYLTWLYNNTRGSLILTILAHFTYNLSSTLITGAVRLMPAMTFYMTAGPLLFLVIVGIIIYFKPKYFSKKSVSELPFKQN